MKTPDSKSKAAALQQKAEELLKKKRTNSFSQLSEAETLKLKHEIEVHQQWESHQAQIDLLLTDMVIQRE
jgi:hypothetical protein